MMFLPNHPPATNLAMTSRCHAEAELRRFVDRKRWTTPRFRMQIVPPSPKARTSTVMVRLKAVVFTASAVVCGFASVGAAFFDLSPQFPSWPAIRVVIWIVQFLLLLAAVWFWLQERPRQMKVEGLPEPPVIHST
jgi:hypothetical protein